MATRSAKGSDGRALRAEPVAAAAVSGAAEVAKPVERPAVPGCHKRRFRDLWWIGQEVLGVFSQPLTAVLRRHGRMLDCGACTGDRSNFLPAQAVGIVTIGVMNDAAFAPRSWARNCSSKRKVGSPA